MSDTGEGNSLAGVLAAAHILVDELHALDLARDTDDGVLAGLRELERLTRRIDSAGYGLISEVQRRGLPEAHGCRSMGRFLRHLLRLDPRDAGTRAAGAAAAGPRTALTGESLAPVFALVAAGQAAGVVSQRHARVIETTIDALPGQVAAEHGATLEADLVGFAADFDPARLAVLARRMVDHLDPDGVFAEPDIAHRRRELHLTVAADGTSVPTGRFTPELTERLLTFFDCAAAPRPATDAIKDTRTLGQRQHDALESLLETAVRSEQVPSNNGVSATVVLTMTTEHYLTGQGLARTGHGALVPAADATRWGGGDTEILATVLGSTREVTHYSHTHRIFTEHQRRVIAARDAGCTFPGCPEPPGRCQVNHTTRHQHHGPTSTDNGNLVCRYHHREHQQLGWTNTMIDSIPYWIPPAWIDPTQAPQRNTLHDTAPAA